MRTTVLITVTGKVHGVFYRNHTRDKASSLGITGYVCNQEDGSVRIVATGDTQQLAFLEQWCWQGPPRAVVVGVQVEQLPLQHFEAFSILR